MKQKIINVDLKVNLDPLISFTLDIFQKKEIRSLTDETASVAGWLWERRWSERNAGNISVNVTSCFTEKELDRFSTYPFLPLNKEYPGLTRQVLMVTAAGSRMRDIAKDPLEGICLVFLGETASAFHVIVPERSGRNQMPTSELPAHLAVHEMLCEKKAPEKVLMHSHVTELIALTHDPRFQSASSITELLWRMHPEALMLQPKGYGFIPFTLPGTEKIAALSAKAFTHNNVVIWEKHGAMAIGKTPCDAFDELDLTAKAAAIYLSSVRSGMEPQGLSWEQIESIKKHYGF